MYKKLTLAFISIFVLLCVSACGAGVNIDEGKKYTEDFWTALNEENYDAAADLMHPISGASVDDIKVFAQNLESQFGFDFSTDSVAITDYTGFKTMLYTSDVDGAMLTLKFKINIGGNILSGSSDIVSNGDGFGISAINIDN
mgnify:FL=1